MNVYLRIVNGNKLVCASFYSGQEVTLYVFESAPDVKSALKITKVVEYGHMAVGQRVKLSLSPISMAAHGDAQKGKAGEEEEWGAQTREKEHIFQIPGVSGNYE